MKSVSLCNCLCSSSLSLSSFSASRIRNLGIVIRYTWNCKSPNMGNRGGEFSFFQEIHVRIDIRIDISYSMRLMITKFDKEVHIDTIWLKMRLIKQMLVMPLRQNHPKNWKHYISITRVSMATKLGRSVTCLDGLLPIKSNNPLITWSYKIIWQTKIIIYPLTQCLWVSILAGWRCTMKSFLP